MMQHIWIRIQDCIADSAHNHIDALTVADPSNEKALNSSFVQENTVTVTPDGKITPLSRTLYTHAPLGCPLSAKQQLHAV